METNLAPFMLIFRDATPESYEALSPQQRQQLLTRWNAWYDALVDQGKARGGDPLEPTGRVVSGPRGERLIDGPYAEAKEAIAGYFYLMVADVGEATEIAQRCPNLPYGMSVEIRPVARACHLAKSLGQTSMRA